MWLTKCATRSIRFNSRSGIFNCSEKDIWMQLIIFTPFSYRQSGTRLCSSSIGVYNFLSNEANRRKSQQLSNTTFISLSQPQQCSLEFPLNCSIYVRWMTSVLNVIVSKNIPMIMSRSPNWQFPNNYFGHLFISTFQVNRCAKQIHKIFASHVNCNSIVQCFDTPMGS